MGIIGKTLTHITQGISPLKLEVEVSAWNGQQPSFNIVGLPDAAVRESVDRIRSALTSSGYVLPVNKVVINLAPADVRKEGASLDLAMAMAILAAVGHVPLDALLPYSLVGELGLDGALRSVPGALALTTGARNDGLKGILLPPGNGAEAAMVEGLDVISVQSLRQAVSFLRGEEEIAPFKVNRLEVLEKERHYEEDFQDVKGQEGAKRALEIAAAGGHNLLMLGSPGGGKTMLAKRIPTILPDMSLEESLETTKIHSVAGLLRPGQSLVATRPFRSPHHSASSVALIGGGSTPKPGEVSLAHHGVLFLDEMAELPRSVLESLRQPLEDGDVTISRASMTLSFPARFLLCAAMNPCPCGYLMDERKECQCSQIQIRKYRNRLSGPLMDRIDLHVEMAPVRYRELREGSVGEKSAAIRQRVEKTRALQRERYARRDGVYCNAHMRGKDLKQWCVLDERGHQMLEKAMEKLGLSARSYDRILKVARTIADLDACETIQTSHLGEAIQYRTLDRE